MRRQTLSHCVPVARFPNEFHSRYENFCLLLTNGQAARSQQPEDIKRAASMIMTQNPFGGTCGVVCPDSFCMAHCVRKDIDKPVNIPAVQAYIIDKANKLGMIPLKSKFC